MKTLRFTALLLGFACSLLIALGAASRASAQCVGDVPTGSVACIDGGGEVAPTDGALENSFSLLATSRFGELSATWWMSRLRAPSGATLAAVREPRRAATARSKTWMGRSAAR